MRIEADVQDISSDTFTPPHPLKTAVLFLIFNRPDTTKQVFTAIRKAKPPRLYVAADGPRSDKPGEAEKCDQVRNIATQVDWDCELKTLLRDKNLGCGKAVSNAIEWFFNSEEEGIILEDDCLPNQSFFWFCQELLKKYKSDCRVMHINGNNFNAPVNQIISEENHSSYYFGSFAQAWGWASWRRAWKKFDYKIQTWPHCKRRGILINKFPNIGTYLEKSLHFDAVYAGGLDIWDYQWQYAVLINDGLVVVPHTNLVSNIGYGDDSTHLKDFDRKRNNLKTKNIDFPLKHPSHLKAEKSLNYHYATHMGMKPQIKKIPSYLVSYFK